MISVLTYNAPHRKTQDLLMRLKIKGYNSIRVLAVPWVKRKNYKPLIPHRNFENLNIKPYELALRLGYDFHEIVIEDLNKFKNDYILIGGAGILPEEVVNCGKIINSHPAYLPYVRGLDSLKWAIYNNEKIGVTTHIISKDCDAGKLIKREIVPIYSWDTFHSLAFRQYDLEINMLVDSIEDVKIAVLEDLSTEISKPTRRMPHSKEKELLKRFDKILNDLQ